MENLDRIHFIKTQASKLDIQKRIEYLNRHCASDISTVELATLFNNDLHTQPALSAINAYAANLKGSSKLALAHAYLGWCLQMSKMPVINFVYWTAALPTRDKLSLVANFASLFDSTKEKLHIALHMMARLDTNISTKQFMLFLEGTHIREDAASEPGELTAALNDHDLVKKLKSLCSASPEIAAELYNISDMFAEHYQGELKKAIRSFSPEVGYKLLHVLAPERKQQASEFIRKHMSGDDIIKKCQWYMTSVVPSANTNDAWYIDYLVELTRCNALTPKELQTTLSFETTNVEALTYSDANPLISLARDLEEPAIIESLLKSIVLSVDMQTYFFKFQEAFKQLEEFAKYQLNNCSDSLRDSYTWILLLSCTVKFDFREPGHASQSILESKKHLKDSSVAQALSKYELLTSLTQDSYSLNDIIIRCLKENKLESVNSVALPTLDM